MARTFTHKSTLVGAGLLIAVAGIAPLALRALPDATPEADESDGSHARSDHDATPPASCERLPESGTPNRAQRVAPSRVAEHDAPADSRVAVAALQSLADRYSDAQEDTAAHEAASRCLALDPANARCAVIRLRSSMRTGEFDRARAETTRCFDLDPSNGTCVYADAMIRLHDGDLDGASASLGELRDVEGDSTMVRVVSASIAMRRGDRSSAMRDLHEACSRGQPWACATERRMDGERDAQRVPPRAVHAETTTSS